MPPVSPATNRPTEDTAAADGPPSRDAAALAGVPDVDTLLDLAVGRLGGARRDGQHAMAGAVAGSIGSGEHLVVQAGTGTGKSLGYLVPAVRHAVATDERVVVSTATLALQRQVITRDLPLVAEAIGAELPRPASIALLKGWHNYVCVHKVAGGYPTDEPTLFDLPGETAGATDHPPARADGRAAPSLGEQVVRVREWAQETTTGDRDDLVPGVSDKAWRQVSVTALECLGQRCPLLAECFPDKARAAAREADVVVTNHAMLGIAAMGSPGVLPEHDVLVVDEAHELADRVTAAATVDLSVPAIEGAARLARRHGGATTDTLDAASAAFGTVVGALPAERFPDGLPDGARDAVAAVRDAAREVLSRLKPETGVQKPATPDTGLKMAQSAMLQLFEVAERMAGDPTGHDVLWCSRPGEGGWSADRFGEGASRLHAAPLGVAGLIRTHLLTERTGVFTSATLALGGTFDAVARTFGLGGGASDGEEAPSWRGLDVGSPFDYPRQGILYVAKHLPTPGREAATEHQLDEIAALVEAAGGRTLGLFSSRRAAVAAAEAMRERLDVPVLCQGDDQLPTLVREFADDPATCLFGTLSLWQGVDVPGPSCQLVLIDRIPFPRPDDPVRSARARAVEAAGGNGFMQVSATHAALLLAQGAGRLVRSTTDRGVVAVLDPRLVTARYGTFLTRSMPGFWQTTDREVAAAALRRLAALG
ncbi:ATP-dependent DNA helicase [Cellulosimicrobium sp. Marseille-Q8652]